MGGCPLHPMVRAALQGPHAHIHSAPRSHGLALILEERTLAHCAEQQNFMEQALADVDTEVLVAELKRRLDCQTKPEKHVITDRCAGSLLATGP